MKNKSILIPKQLSTLIIFCLFNTSFSIAQKDTLIYFAPEIGVSTSQGEELSKVYDLGGRLTGAVSFPVIRNIFRLSPNISMNYFGNNYNEGVRDNLLFWNFGAKLEPNTKVDKKFKIVPYLGFGYLIGKNYLTPRKDFKGDRVDLFSFSGMGFDFGLKVIFKSNIFINANYQIVTMNGEIDNQIKNEIKDKLDINDALFDVVYFPSTEFSFNNFTLSIGYNFCIK